MLIQNIIKLFCLSILISTVFLTSNAFGISEENYFEEYNKKVTPFYKSKGITGEFKGVKDVKISYRKFIHKKEKAAVVILSGRTEHYLKYGEVIYDIYNQGYSVYIMDHRGQGLSGRETDHHQVNHVDTYDDYVKDLRIFLKEVVLKTPHPKLYAIGHSMGSNIMALFGTMYPNVFDRFIWVSPMLDIDTPPFPVLFAYYLTRMAGFVGLGKSYVLGGGDFNPVEVNRVTHSEPRYKKNVELRVGVKEALVGAPSWRWLGASLESNWRIRKTTYKITAPILMLQAGIDLVVLTEGQNVICRQAIRCHKVVFPNAYHEIMMEKDIIRDRAFKEMFKFMEEGLKENN